MTSIYLIRHGQASFGEKNYDQLSQLGHRQATRLGQALAERLGQFDQICIGSMQRHHQTANNCLTAMGNKIPSADWDVDAGWNEYDHENILAKAGPGLDSPDGIRRFLSSTDDPKSAFESLYQKAMARWLSGEHDGDYTESWHDYNSRIRNALKRVTEQYPDAKRIAVFTSGGPITVVSQSLLGIPAHNIMDLNWTLLNCGVTKLVTTQRRLFVASLNEHSHFEGEYRHMLSYK